MEKTLNNNRILFRFINNAQSKPARMIALSFLFVILIGSVLLSLPSAAADGQPAGPLRAIFTATSATCVTGLVLVDTSTYWSMFGQIVILVLIQIGGLGLVTITTFFFTLFRKKMGIRTIATAKESTAGFNIHEINALLVKVISFTFIFELIGAILFSIRFIPEFGLKGGIYRSVFHSVSSFCNAGFDLFGSYSGKFSSLTAWAGDPLVILMTAFMIISGGIGFIVWSDLLNFNKSNTEGKKKGMNFHSKLVLRITAILIISGTLFILLMQYTSADNGLPFARRLLDAFFQSVTTRTAGFNTIDQSALAESSKIGSSILMFIGASPGSTGGGIKVTTITIIIAYVISQIRGCECTLIRKKRIERNIVSKAIIIFSIAVLIITLDTLAMSIIERLAISAGEISTLDLLFESVSAFSTVGLSAASTPDLHSGSHIILILTMYIGRIGPAAFAIAITGRTLNDKGKVYPEVRLNVG